MFRFVTRVSLFLVGFSLPISSLGFQIPGFPITANKLATAFLLILAAIYWLFGGHRRPRDRKAPWALAFGASFAISNIVGLVQDAPVVPTLVVTTTFLALILYLFLIPYVVATRSDLVLLMWSLVLGAAFASSPLLLGFHPSVGEERFEGLSSANVLGLDLLVCLAMAAALFFSTRRQWARLILGGAIALIMAGILLSLSRAAFVSVALMWGLWIYRSGRLDTIKYAIPALLLLAGVALFSPRAVVQRVETIINPRARAADTSIQSRFTQVPVAAMAFGSNPLLGVGTVNFHYWSLKIPGSAGEEIHNAYLNIAATQGLLGLIPFLLIFGLTWNDYGRAIRTVRARRRLRDRQLAELGHYAVFLQIAFAGTMLDSVFHPTQKSKSLWLCFALSTVLVSLVRQRVAELEAGAELGERTEPAPAFAGPGFDSEPARAFGG